MTILNQDGARIKPFNVSILFNDCRKGVSLWVQQVPRPINTASQDTFLSVHQNEKKPRNQAVSGLIIHIGFVSKITS